MRKQLAVDILIVIVELVGWFTLVGSLFLPALTGIQVGIVALAIVVCANIAFYARRLERRASELPVVDLGPPPLLQNQPRPRHAPPQQYAPGIKYQPPSPPQHPEGKPWPAQPPPWADDPRDHPGGY